MCLLLEVCCIVAETRIVTAIGVSNFSIKKTERLLQTAEVTPAANQVELHPYLTQQDLVDFCHSKGIAVEAYSPLGSNDSPLSVLALTSARDGS